MGMTLTEAAKYAGATMESLELVRLVEESSMVMMEMPSMPLMGIEFQYKQQTELPRGRFRSIGGKYAESKSQREKVTEEIHPFGIELPIDTMILSQMDGQMIMEQELEAQIQSIGLDIGKTIFKGDNKSTPEEFSGFQARANNTQIFSAGNTAGGAALSLKTLKEAIRSVPGATHLYMSGEMWDLITDAAEAVGISGTISFMKNDFGVDIPMYRSLRIVDPEKDAGGADILQFNEAAVSGSATATSIYVVRQNGTPSGVCTLQGMPSGEAGIRSVVLGEDQQSPERKIRTEMYIGLKVPSNSMARIRHVGKLAVTA